MIYEKFQNNNSQNETLDSAYSGNSLNIIGNNSNLGLGKNTITEENSESNNSSVSNSNNYHEHIELEDSKFDFNIWDILGVSNLSKETHNCMFDCGIKSLHSLEKCGEENKNIYETIDNKTNEKCKLKSYKEALKCAKNCYNLDHSNNLTTASMPTTSSITTQSLQTSNATQLLQDLKFNNNNVKGTYSLVNNLSPIEDKYWPGFNKYGWNTNSIDEYNQNLSDKVIEVRSKEFQEFDIAKPYIEFDTHSINSKSKQFFPYLTDKPHLEYDKSGLDMILHEVEDFQNYNNNQYNKINNKHIRKEGFQNQNNKVNVDDKVFKVGQLVLDRKCPHNGCKLEYNKEQHEFQCPCHNSKFNMRGDCISGPACPSNLRI